MTRRNAELPHGQGTEDLPAGIELPDGRVLAFAPSRECGCRDCVDAFTLYDSGMLFLPPSAEELPW